MGEPYLVTLSPKTYLRLKRTNEKKLLHCHKCVSGDTLLLGDNKLISEYAVGDHVASQTGNVRVNNTFRHDYDGKMIKIKAAGLLPLKVTPEHPLLVVLRSPGNKGMKFSQPYWMKAGDLTRAPLKSDGTPYLEPMARYCLMIPRLEQLESPPASLSLRGYAKSDHGIDVTLQRGLPLDFPINEETAWLLGIYVAEGCVGGRETLTFSFNHDEAELQTKVVNIGKRLGYSPYVIKAETATNVYIASRLLGRAFPDWCGHLAPNKKIPDFILFNQPNIVRAFLDGYLKGDGYIDSKDFNHSGASTTSKILVMQLQLAFARLGVPSTINFGAKGGKSIIEGREVNTHDSYHINVLNQRKNDHMKVMDDYILTPIRQVERFDYNGSVYNLETTDNTYLVSNAIVHNCSKEFEMGDEVAFNCGSSRKRYHKNCANQVNFIIDPPKDYEEKREAILEEVKEWKKEQEKNKEVKPKK